MAEDLGLIPEIRFAVVGLGFMGRTHVAAMSDIPAATFSAVVDREPGRLSGTMHHEGNIDTGVGEAVFDPSEVDVVGTVEAMLAHRGGDLGLAIVTTPTPTHIDIASSLVSAGLHVLVEKPVSLDVDSIERLGASARDRGVIAMPAHCMRFWPAWNWMHQRIQEETFGPVRRASFARTGAAPSWNPDFYLDTSKSGGAIVDLHIHDTDFVIHSFGLPDAVSSVGDRSYVRTRYVFKDGPLVEAVGGWLEDSRAPFTMTAEIECQSGTISFMLGRDPEILVTLANGLVSEHPEASSGGTGYEVQARALVKAIRSGGCESPVSMEDAMRTGRVLQLEIESVKSNGELRSTR